MGAVMSDDTRYAYAVARVRGMEMRLLDRQWVERLLSESATGAIKALGDSAYEETISEIEKPEEIEIALMKALGETLSEVSSMSPEPELIDLFRLRWDHRNLKSLMKAACLKVEIDERELIAPIGTVSLEGLEAAARDKNYMALPEHLADAAKQAHEAYREQGEVLEIDRIIDLAMWDHSIEVAERARNAFLVEFFRTEIDLANIRTFVRMKVAGRDRSDLDRVIILHGRLDRSFFLRHMEESLDVFARDIEYGRYGELAATFRDWSNEKSFPLLERACDDCILKELEAAKTTAYGIEPLVAFIIYRQIESKLIRSAVIAKVDGVDRGEVESRLRSIHV